MVKKNGTKKKIYNRGKSKDGGAEFKTVSNQNYRQFDFKNALLLLKICSFKLTIFLIYCRKT